MKSTDYYLQTIVNLVKAQGELADVLTAKEEEIAKLKVDIAALKTPAEIVPKEPDPPGPSAAP